MPVAVSRCRVPEMLEACCAIRDRLAPQVQDMNSLDIVIYEEDYRAQQVVAKPLIRADLLDAMRGMIGAAD
jgi:hypothetical protein